MPTRNEVGNVEPLLARLDRALGSIDAEILFVDDSSDATPDQIRTMSATASRPIRLLHRAPEQRVGGLGGAVLAGLRSAHGDWAVVMDGDLQHPPEVVPDLLLAGEQSGADLVVASRYAHSGGAGGLSTAVRHRVSRGANRLTRALFPRRLAGCSDPMSGFFAVRKGSIELDRLRPRGFKILLEAVCRSPRLKVVEVPFVFEERCSGNSKASAAEGFLLVRKLITLRVASVFGRRSSVVARAAGFGLVGTTGIVVNSLALWMFVSALGTNVLLGAALATQCSTIWNYVLTDVLIFKGPKRRSGWLRFAGFAVVNNAVLLVRLPVLSWLFHSVGMGYLTANVLTLVAAFAVRFVIADRYLFRPGVQMSLGSSKLPSLAETAIEPSSTSSTKSSAHATKGRPVELVIDLRGLEPSARRPAVQPLLPFRYDVHGIVTIGSAVLLKELEAFRTQHVHGPLDIEIRPGRIGHGRLRRRTRVTQYMSPAGTKYEEHLGRYGADFSIEMGTTIDVVVGPMLVRSPHVLYTNIIEALLRFVMVSRGYMLLHSACLELEGRGVMMSALTDTGKTGTILRLLRENDSRFLSDDMTIMSADGMALTYPKPLTISQHTLRAVKAGDLSKKEWRRLRLQSRLHSKEGRGIGTRLGEMNVPIMSLNAFTQYIVPPPKYDVDRLVPCTKARSIRVEELFIIERNEYSLTEIESVGLVDELIANTDDAYGFPPYRYFAPALVVNGMGYEELRAAERTILTQALSGIRTRRLATPDYTWADRIPALARETTVLDLGPFGPFRDARNMSDDGPTARSATAERAE